MHSRSRWPLVAALLLLSAPPGRAGGTMLRQMSLKDLATRAEKVFRGQVVGIDSTTVRTGGIDLPVTVYRLKVEEEFKGTFDAPKGEPVIEVRMLSAGKSRTRVGDNEKLSVLSDLPRLEMGRDYVLFTTRPSAIGLSTTVGLGQGAFAIEAGTKEELTANAYGNVGLARGRTAAAGLPPGRSVPYAQLAQAIRQAIEEVQP